MNSPDRFLESFCHELGGASQRRGAALELLAPPGSALPELATVWTDSDHPPEPGSESVFPGHPWLDQAVQEASRSGLTTARHLATGRSQRPGLLDLARKSWEFRNSRAEFAAPLTAIVPWAVFTFLTTFHSDDQREALLQIGVDLHTLARVETESLTPGLLAGGSLAGSDRSGLGLAYARAQGYLVETLESRRRSQAREAARGLECERTRLEHYYDGLLQDLEGRLKRARVRQESLLAKRDQVLRDRDTRRKDLDERFRLKVSAKLCCLELIDLPRQLVPVRLTGKGGDRDLVVSYNFLTHGFDPWPCQGCGQAGRVLYKGHDNSLVCHLCHRECSRCRRSLTATQAGPRCAVGNCLLCPSCDASPCPGCQQRVCLQHQGRCHPEAQPPRLSPTMAGLAAAIAPSSKPPRPIQRLFERISLPGELRSRLQHADAQLEVGLTGPAREAIESISRDFRGDSPAFWKLLEKVCEELATRDPARARQRLALLEPMAQAPPSGRDEVLSILGELKSRLIPPDLREAAVALWTRVAALSPQTPNPRARVAGLLYVAGHRLTQKEAGRCLGVSAATVSNEAQVIRYLLDRLQKATKASAK